MRRKFGNKKQVFNGITFDSGVELQRYKELLKEQDEGRISGLLVHASFPLNAFGHIICRIQPDFIYTRDGVTVVEDTKSKATLTPSFRIKEKMFYAQYGIPITRLMLEKGAFVQSVGSRPKQSEGDSTALRKIGAKATPPAKRARNNR